MKKIFGFFKRIYHFFVQRFSYEDAEYEECEEIVPVEYDQNREPIRTVSAHNLANNLDKNEFEFYYTRIRKDIENQFEVLHSRHEGAQHFALDCADSNLPQSVKDQLTKDGFLIQPSPYGEISCYAWRLTLPESYFTASKNADSEDTSETDLSAAASKDDATEESAN